MTYRQPFSGDYPITQNYGETITDPNGHTGIDYGCPVNTPILASNDGLIVFCGWNNTGYGNMVIIQHNDGQSTLYAHLTQCACFLKQKVQQGDVIGYSGNTGNSTGSHLHFEARKKWDDYKSHFDPMLLPLMNFADYTKPDLKEADQLGHLVQVVAPDGAKRFNQDWTLPYPPAYPYGTKLYFTGKTVTRPGYPYTYCEVYPEPQKYYVAVHDGTTQILDSQ